MTFHATHFGAAPVRDPFAGVAIPAFLQDGRAACAGRDPELWFDGDTEEGGRICREECPLVLGCREWEKERKEWGVWGDREPRKNGVFPKDNECGHPEREHYAHGKCHACYSREKYQTRAVYTCIECGRKRTIRGLGRCGACYSRIHRAAS